MAGIVTTAEIDIAAAPAQVWSALTDPDLISEYMFGSKVQTDWQPGSPITWSGEYEGTEYEDKGEIVEFEPERKMVVTHFSPMSGQEDRPENYHTLTYELTGNGETAHLTLSQDNNADEEGAERAKATWAAMLDSLKEVAERP